MQLSRSVCMYDEPPFPGSSNGRLACTHGPGSSVGLWRPARGMSPVAELWVPTDEAHLTASEYLTAVFISIAPIAPLGPGHVRWSFEGLVVLRCRTTVHAGLKE